MRVAIVQGLEATILLHTLQSSAPARDVLLRHATGQGDKAFIAAQLHGAWAHLFGRDASLA